MARTLSTMKLALGAPAPAIRLPDAHGKQHELAQLRGPQGLLVAFICNHCPFVKHVGPGLGELARWAKARGVGAVGINSNDAATHPDDRPELMPAEAQRCGWAFPYLVDAEQSVARAYHAACTPDFFLFDANLRLVYRGQMDGSRPDNDVPVSGSDLRAAIERTLAGQPPLENAKPSLGCNIKWKPGTPA